ncbi:MAG: hypothetical protein ACSLFO_05365 [Acidimicrobiales bacterium]
MARTIGTLLVTAALFAGACGGDDASDDAGDVTVPVDESSTTSSSTTEPTTTTEDPKAAVEQAFYDQWDAFVEISSAPDIEHPLIDQHFTGEAKEALLDGVSRLLADGEGFRLPEDQSSFHPRVVKIEMTSEDQATVFECTVEGLVIFNRTTGDVVNDSVADYERRNEFKLVNDRWLVSETVELAEGEPGCDAL